MSFTEWKLLWSTDDRAVYLDKNNVVHMRVAQEDSDANTVHVYTFECEPCVLLTVASNPDDESTALDADDEKRHDAAREIRERSGARQVLVHAGIARAHRARELRWNMCDHNGEWFADSLDEIADYTNQTRDELIAALTGQIDGIAIVARRRLGEWSDDERSALAWAYESIGSYHGFDNLDSYPDVWTASEFASWPDRGPAIDEDEFIAGYVACALWTGVGSPDPNATDHIYDLDDSLLTDEARAKMEADCRAFIVGNGLLLRDYIIAGRTASDAGHDFWLTRNGHGTGFWDRDLPDTLGDDLTEASKRRPFGETWLYAEWDPRDCTTEDESHEDYVPPDDRDVSAIHVL